MNIDSGLPLMTRAAVYAGRPAIVDANGEHGYGDLLEASGRVAAWLLDGHDDLHGARIAFAAQPGFPYVAAQWGIWRAGGVAVPLCLSHPPAEHARTLDDARPAAILADEPCAGALRPLTEARGIRLGMVADALGSGTSDGGWLPTVGSGRPAMILYTSGTTSRPKGVVLTHANLTAQIVSLIQAWEWTGEDRILNVLPLHHTHGIVNALLCPLWAGAACEMLPAFDADRVWRGFIEGGITIFTAVPTIYVRLIAAWDRASREERKRMSRAAASMRVMISGSAALPVPVFDRWKELSGHPLLERYGMTEIGMALSNPLHGERRPGTVGSPLPGVSVKLMDEGGRAVVRGISGELWVRGAAVFHEYWDRPEETAAAFTNGWFRTGDQAMVDDGYYRILGRTSIDILKTGGHKVSALEIEEAMRAHPGIADCAVVGVSDPEWGQRVCAAVVVSSDASLSLEALREWGRERLAPYKLPTRLVIVDELPRNSMGKVAKTTIRTLFDPVGAD